MITWRRCLESARADVGDDSQIVAVAPDEHVLDVEFDGGWGSANGPSVLIWSEKRVYFPVTYDGAEWLDSAPRDPVNEGQGHVGGQ